MQYPPEEAYTRLISHNMTVPQRIKVKKTFNTKHCFFMQKHSVYRNYNEMPIYIESVQFLLPSIMSW